MSRDTCQRCVRLRHCRGTTPKVPYLLASKPSRVASDHDHLCLGPRSGGISTRPQQLVHRRALIPIQCGNRRSTAELAPLADDLQPRSISAFARSAVPPGRVQSLSSARSLTSAAPALAQ